MTDMLPLDVDPDATALFEASLDRCLGDPLFVSRFYTRFLGTDAEVRERFANVDIDRQARALSSSLYLVLRAARGFEDGLYHLGEIAHSHAKHGYDIRPHHYEHWLETLLAVASEADPRYDDETRDAWEATLRPCIDRMIAAWAAGRDD